MDIIMGNNFIGKSAELYIVNDQKDNDEFIIYVWENHKGEYDKEGFLLITHVETQKSYWELGFNVPFTSLKKQYIGKYFKQERGDI